MHMFHAVRKVLLMPVVFSHSFLEVSAEMIRTAPCLAAFTFYPAQNRHDVDHVISQCEDFWKVAKYQFIVKLDNFIPLSS